MSEKTYSYIFNTKYRTIIRTARAMSRKEAAKKIYDELIRDSDEDLWDLKEIERNLRRGDETKKILTL